jgi:hypothetical protein
MDFPPSSTATGSPPADHGLASLDDGLLDDDGTGSNPVNDDKKVQEEGQDTPQASLDAGLPVDDDTGFNSLIDDNKVLQEAQPQRNLATLPPTHSITPGSQLADHGPSTLDDALPVDEDAGFNAIVLHDKVDEDVRQGVVELDVESESKAVLNDDEYAVLVKTNDHTMDAGVPDSASFSTQPPGTDTLFYTNST